MKTLNEVEGEFETDATAWASKFQADAATKAILADAYAAGMHAGALKLLEENMIKTKVIMAYQIPQTNKTELSK